MRLALASLLLTLAGCASSAPHTIAAAAVNGGLAAGAAGVQRASGGCYAICTNGTVCNPATGFCERAGAIPDPGLAACLPGEACARPGDQAISKQGPAASSGVASPVGISPATGTTPPFPPATSVTPPQTPAPVRPE